MCEFLQRSDKDWPPEQWLVEESVQPIQQDIASSIMFIHVFLLE